MTPRDVVILLFMLQFLAVVPTFVFAAIAAQLVNRKSWWLLALSNLGMMLTLAALLVQFSPYSNQEVKAAMSWIQRGGITAWIVGSVWLTWHMMSVENGRLAVVRDVVRLKSLRRFAQKLWSEHGGSMANRRDAA